MHPMLAVFAVVSDYGVVISIIVAVRDFRSEVFPVLCLTDEIADIRPGQFNVPLIAEPHIFMVWVDPGIDNGNNGMLAFIFVA